MADIDIKGRDQNATRLLREMAALAEQVGVKFSDLKQIMSEMDNQGRQTAATLKGIDEAGRRVTVTITGLTAAKDKFRVRTTESTTALKDENKALSDQELIMKQLAQAERQRNEARKVLRSVQRGFTERELFKQDVTPQEFFNLKKAEANLADFVAKNNISAKTVVRIWRDVAANSFKAYRGELAEVQKRTFDLVKAQQAVGASARREMKRAQTATQDASKSVREFTLSWESIKRIIAIQVLRRLLFGLTNQIRQATLQMKEFSKAVAEIRTISQNAQLTTLEWEKGLTRLSNAFGLDVLDVAEAAYQTLSNQVAEGAETFEFLEQAIRFGITTQTSATDSVQLLTAAINAYGLSAKDAEDVAASFFKTIELGRIRGSELGNTFGRVAILGDTLGITLNELQATLTTLTRRGIRTSEAMTQLRGFLLKLVKPTEEMRKLLQELGVDSGEAAIEAFGLSGFLQILEKRTAGSTTELAKFVSRIRGLIAAVGLTGEGFDAYAKDLDEIRNAQESYVTASEIAFDNLGRRADITFQEIANTIREDFGKPILEIITSVNDSMISLSVVVKNLGVAIATLGGAQIIFKAIRGLEAYRLQLKAAAAESTTLATKTKFLSLQLRGSITTLGTAALAVGIIVKSLLEDYVKRFDEAAEKTQKFNEAVLKSVRRQSEQSVKFFDDFSKAISDNFAVVAGDVSRALKVIDDDLEDVEDDIKKGAKEFQAAWTDAGKVVEDQIKDIADAQKDALEDVEKLGDFAKDFRLEVEETLFKRDLELAPNVDKQFSRIEARIDTLRTRINEAFKAGNVDLIQELARDILKLQSELDSLDRKAIEKNEDLVGELKDERQKAAEELASITRQLAVAQQKNDAQDIEKLKRDRLEVLRELETAERDLNKDLKKFQSDRLGEYKDEYSRTLTALVKETEEKVVELQGRLLLQALELEKKKQAEQIKFDILRDQLRQLRQEPLTAEFFEQDEETLNALLARRVKLIKDSVIALKEFGQEEAAVKLEAQLADERDFANLQFRKIAFTNNLQLIKDQVTASKELLATKQKELLENRLLIERAQVGLKTLEKEVNLQEQLAAASGEFFSGIGFVAGVDITPAIDKAEAKILQQVLDELTEAQKEFLDTGKRSQDVLEGLRDFRILYAEFGGILDKTTEQQIKATEAQLGAAAAGESTIEILISEQEAYQQEIDELIKQQGTLTSVITESNQSIARSYEKDLKPILEEIKALQLGAQQAASRIVGGPDFFARGGIASSDTIPAMLSPGEFVMNAKSTRRFYSQLHGMNSGFARGGTVNTTNVGDIHIHGFKPSGNDSADVVRLGRQLRREIRRGTVRLS